MSGDIERYCLDYGIWAKEPMRRPMKVHAAVLLSDGQATTGAAVMGALAVSLNTAVKALLANGYLLVDDGKGAEAGTWEHVPQHLDKIRWSTSTRGKKAPPKVAPSAAAASEWWDIPELLGQLNDATTSSLRMAGLELRVQARRVP